MQVLDQVLIVHQARLYIFAVPAQLAVKRLGRSGHLTMLVSAEGLRYTKDRNSRPKTNGERAQSGVSLSSGAGANAGLGNGCLLWYYYELHPRDMTQAPDLYRTIFECPHAVLY